MPTGAIAVVGDQTITQEQFDEIWAQAKSQYAATEGAPTFPKEGSAEYDQLKASIINYLVQNALMTQEAAKMNVTVSAKDMDARVKQITEQVGGQKKLDKLLKEQGVTMAQLKEQLKAQMLQEAVRPRSTPRSRSPTPRPRSTSTTPTTSPSSWCRTRSRRATCS